MKGCLRKLRYENSNPLKVYLPVGDCELLLNDILGKTLILRYNGLINCVNCTSKTSKSYGGGYCYRCFMQLAECDMCILKPETCHRASGTCRNNVWSDNNCMSSHLVYLAYTSEVKVGITRSLTGLPRWYDQGAICALPILQVPDRLAAGKVEVFLKQEFSDKTSWRQMLEANVSLDAAISELKLAYQKAGELLESWTLDHQFDRFNMAAEVASFHYPVLNEKLYFNRITFDKNSDISGKVIGVRGQYLLLDCGVLNIRQHTGYYVEVA